MNYAGIKKKVKMAWENGAVFIGNAILGCFDYNWEKSDSDGHWRRRKISECRRDQGRYLDLPSYPFASTSHAKNIRKAVEIRVFLFFSSFFFRISISQSFSH